MENKIIINHSEAFSYYPNREEIDQWAQNLYQKSLSISVEAVFRDDMPVTPSFGNNPNTLNNRFIAFKSTDHAFYGYWQPALKSPAPLLINLPGYGGYISNHPQINDDGYHILHLSPLGYVTPTGIDSSRLMPDGNWPVLDLSAHGMKGGYEDWLLDCLLAIRWAKTMPEVISNRISLFGTSQGGGTSLLLASILQNQIRCVCADLPFLTAFPLSDLQGDAYGILQQAYHEVNHKEFWHNIGFIDTVSHVHRFHIPVMLSAGGKDNVCPAESVKYLFDRLETTKQFTHLSEGIHTHSRESMYLFRSWLALFA